GDAANRELAPELVGIVRVVDIPVTGRRAIAEGLSAETRLEGVPKGHAGARRDVPLRDCRPYGIENGGDVVSGRNDEAERGNPVQVRELVKPRGVCGELKSAHVGFPDERRIDGEVVAKRAAGLTSGDGVRDGMERGDGRSDSQASESTPIHSRLP